MLLERVISGGQTGADQAGLRAAKAAGLITGGWMPAGYLTEAGKRPEFSDLYGMNETLSSGYKERTRLNCANSDVTLWFGDPSTPGGKLTYRFCPKPWLAIWSARKQHDWPIPKIAGWLIAPTIMCRTLNVAGNRESKSPGIGAWVEDYLSKLFEVMRENKS